MFNLISGRDENRGVAVAAQECPKFEVNMKFEEVSNSNELDFKPVAHLREEYRPPRVHTVAKKRRDNIKKYCLVKGCDSNSKNKLQE